MGRIVLLGFIHIFQSSLKEVGLYKDIYDLFTRVICLLELNSSAAKLQITTSRIHRDCLV